MSFLNDYECQTYAAAQRADRIRAAGIIDLSPAELAAELAAQREPAAELGIIGAPHTLHATLRAIAGSTVLTDLDRDRYRVLAWRDYRAELVAARRFFTRPYASHPGIVAAVDRALV